MMYITSSYTWGNCSPGKRVQGAGMKHPDEMASLSQKKRMRGYRKYP